MSSGAFVGLIIAVNAARFAAGHIWAKRRLKWVAAERAATYRGLFVLKPLPPLGAEVQILVDDEGGMLGELDAVYWPHLGWINLTTLLRVEDDVIGWRWRPTRERLQQNPATSSRETLRLAAHGPKSTSAFRRPSGKY